MRAWKRRLVAAVMVTFAGCRCQRPAPPVATDAASAEVDAGAPAAVLLVNDESINDAQWTADGAVIALSQRRFWWFQPEGGGRAQTTVLSGDDHFSHFAAAKKKDVSVVTLAGKAHVFRGPKKVLSFDVGDNNAKALSDDGSLLVTERMVSSSATGTQFRGGLYDLATGKRLSEHESVPVLSPNGEWLLDGGSVRATRTGEEILKLPEEPYFLSNQEPWFDGGVMVWTKGGLVVADPKTRSVVMAPARCKEKEIDELIEVVDTATKQAVRFCGARVLVVRLGPDKAPTVVEVPIPAARKDAKPSLAFARDDGAPLLNWGFPAGSEIDRIDLGARSLVKAVKGIERTAPRTRDTDGAPSPDGRYRLRVDSFLSRGAAVIVRDAAGKDVIKLGVITAWVGLDAIAPFVHAHGLDVMVGNGLTRHRVRIGPDAAPPEDLPRLEPDDRCHGTESEGMPGGPQRTLTGGAAIFAWPSGTTCLCLHGGCTDPNLPLGVRARRDDKLIVSEPWRNAITYLEQRKERGTTTPEGTLEGAAFLDDGAGAALLTQHRTRDDDTWRLSEVKLPSFERQGEALTIEHPMFYGWEYTLVGTKGAIAVFMTDRYTLKGWIIPRGHRDGGPWNVTRIEGWDDSAVVSFPDGRMELYGPAAESAVVCADGLGAVTPFAACRARFEAKGVFRID